MSDKLLEALANGGPSFVLLTLVLFWVFTRYIPEQRKMFEDTLNRMIETFNHSNEMFAGRLDRIEEALLAVVKKN